MSAVLVPYRVRPECVELNEQLVGDRCEDPPVATGVRRIGRYDGSQP